MKKLITLSFAIVCFISSFAQFNYPATKTVDSSDTYFGVTYKDPYRWLENFKDPEVVTWFKQQADLSSSILNKISGRDELIAEWKMLDKLQPPRINGRNYDNGHFTENKSVTFANFADQFAFAMWQCGHPDFQLKK